MTYVRLWKDVPTAGSYGCLSPLGCVICLHKKSIQLGLPCSSLSQCGTVYPYSRVQNREHHRTIIQSIR